MRGITKEDISLELGPEMRLDTIVKFVVFPAAPPALLEALRGPTASIARFDGAVQSIARTVVAALHHRYIVSDDAGVVATQNTHNRLVVLAPFSEIPGRTKLAVLVLHELCQSILRVRCRKRHVQTTYADERWE